MRHTVSVKDGWWACSCGMGGKGSGKGHDARLPRVPSPPAVGKGQGLTFIFPPGVWEDPPDDRRRFTGRVIVPPHDLVFNECRRHPGKWAWLGVSNRPDNVAWRVRHGRYAATAKGRWDAVQRSLGDGSGFAGIFVKYEGDEP